MNREQLPADFVYETAQRRIEMILERTPTVEGQDEVIRREAAAVTEHQAKIREGFDELFKATGFVSQDEEREECPEIVLDSFEDSDFGNGKLVARVINYPKSGAVGTYVRFISESSKDINMPGETFSLGGFGEDYVAYARTAINDPDGQFVGALFDLRREEESLKKSDETLKLLSNSVIDYKLNPELAIRADVSNPQQT